MYVIHAVWCFVPYSTNNIIIIQPTPDQQNADREALLLIAGTTGNHP